MESSWVVLFIFLHLTGNYTIYDKYDLCSFFLTISDVLVDQYICRLGN